MAEEKVKQERLGKRLAYLLRYGAEANGLEVSPEGFVDLDALLGLPLLHNIPKEQVLQEVLGSRSMRGLQRFELREHDRSFKWLIRATYGRRMARNPCHPGTRVPRLLQRCVEVVGANATAFDLTDFPDSYTLNVVMRWMRRRGLLTNRALRSFCVPALTHVSFWDVHVTERTLRHLGKSCPGLEWLVLRDCGYVVTDHLLGQLLPRFPRLLSLHLLGCRHLTQASLALLPKHCPRLRHLNLTFLKGLSSDGLLDLIRSLHDLEELNYYDYRGFKGGAAEELEAVVSERPLRVEVAGRVFGGDPATVHDSPWEKPNYR